MTDDDGKITKLLEALQAEIRSIKRRQQQQGKDIAAVKRAVVPTNESRIVREIPAKKGSPRFF
jgi:hypothetical protein